MADRVREATIRRQPAGAPVDREPRLLYISKQVAGRPRDGQGTGFMVESETLEEAKRNIVEEFTLFDDWVGRYEYIVELGRGLEGLPEAFKTETYRVKGCQSQVWFHAEDEDGRIRFQADSDAVIVRGLIALLLRVYSGRTPEEIIATPPDFFEKIELGSHLSGSRANGLHAMINHIQGYAASMKSAAETAPAE
jgi:cysteine desulfuration protein SufE